MSFVNVRIFLGGVSCTGGVPEPTVRRGSDRHGAGGGGQPRGVQRESHLLWFPHTRCNPRFTLNSVEPLDSFRLLLKLSGDKMKLRVVRWDFLTNTRRRRLWETSRCWSALGERSSRLFVADTHEGLGLTLLVSFFNEQLMMQERCLAKGNGRATVVACSTDTCFLSEVDKCVFSVCCCSFHF